MSISQYPRKKYPKSLTRTLQQKTLAEFGSSVAQAAPTVPTPVAPLSVPQTPASALPPHMQQQQQPHSRTSTPPSAVPPVMPSQQQQSYAYANGQQYYGAPAPQQAYGYQGHPYHQAQAAYPGYPPTYGAPQPPPQATQTSVLPEALAAIPDDQKVHMTSFHLPVVFLTFLFSQGSYHAGPFDDT